MSYYPNKAGLIYLTYRKRNAISFVIHFIQTGKLQNLHHTPTHSAQSIIDEGRYRMHDADWPGVRKRDYGAWRKGRAHIIVIDPGILKTIEDELRYSQEAIRHVGNRYGWEDIKGFVETYTGKPFTGETDPDKADDNMICSIMTAYLYKFNNWWKRYPKDLMDNYLVDAPNAKIVYSGAP